MIPLRASPVFLHIAAWMLFMSLPLLFINDGDTISLHSIFANLIFCSFYISIFYINAYWLIPSYYLKKKYIFYGTCLLFLFATVFVLKPFDALMNHARLNNRERQMPPMRDFMPPPPFGRERNFPPADGRMPGGFQKFDITSLFIFFMIIGLSTALQSMKQWAWHEKRAIIAEADKANYELSFLKAQINPHFLYNTLNNIYTLVITGSANAGESIMKLSSIMRYITDEAEADFVSLTHELECMSNFIDLQKLRLSKKMTLKYAVKGNALGHKISPLVLMTFIENAFKYGISNHTAATIAIDIDIEPERISFRSSNQIFEHKKPLERIGVGLINTRKRLDFLYPGRHLLEITEEAGYFNVNLILETRPNI